MVEPAGKTTYFPFPGYAEEVNGSTVTRRVTYTIAGTAVASRVQVLFPTSSNTLYRLYTDHLGSTVTQSTMSGGAVAGTNTYYLPYGSYRGTPPTQTLTDRDFTGQRENRELGLLYFNARFYVPSIGRFLSPDSLVPSPSDPQSLNRYTYVRNSPVNRIDPTGHVDCALLGDANDSAGCNGSKPQSTTAPLLPERPCREEAWGQTVCGNLPGLSNRPRPYGGAGPGGVQAYNGLLRLQEEGGGWWGNEIDAQEALIILLYEEYGNMMSKNHELPLETIEVTANRYSEFCSDGSWSADCFNGFWAYVHPITDMEDQVADRNDTRRSDYNDPKKSQALSVTADSILNGTFQGSKAPFHYATVSSSEGILKFSDPQNSYFSYPFFSNGKVIQIFVILTSDQYRGTER